MVIKTGVFFAEVTVKAVFNMTGFFSLKKNYI